MLKLASFFKNKLWRIGLFGIIYLLSTVASYFYFNLERVVVKNAEPEEQELRSVFDVSPLPVPEDPSTYNVLLLGYGGAGHSGGGLADSMILVHIDPNKKVSGLISIPRDIWIKLPQENSQQVNKKLNNAYALGGGKLAKDAVSSVVGMPVNYFVAISFDGFKKAVDELGGIEVDVPVAFNDYWYPVKGLENDPCGKTQEEIEEIGKTMSGFEGEKQFPCRYEQIHFDKGSVIMDGETALKFVRSRHSAEHGGDFARSERQFALLQGIKKKLLDLGAIDDSIAFFNRMSRSVSTDLDEKSIKMLTEVVGEVSGYSVVNIQLTENNVLQASRSNDGQFILLPKQGDGEWKSIHDFIQSELNGN